MKQDNQVRIQSEDKKITIYADNDTPLGVMHDFLLKLKGEVVDRIYASQKEENDAAEKLKNQKVEE